MTGSSVRRTPFALLLALRYLRSTRRDSFASFLSKVAAGGIALGVAALILFLAALSGFQEAVRSDVLAHTWARSYDLSVRLLPDVGLQADGVRSTNDAFRDEIDAILDRILPLYLPPDRAMSIAASDVTADFDWWAIAERLAGVAGEPLIEGQMAIPIT